MSRSTAQGFSWVQAVALVAGPMVGGLVYLLSSAPPEKAGLYLESGRLDDRRPYRLTPIDEGADGRGPLALHHPLPGTLRMGVAAGRFQLLSDEPMDLSAAAIDLRFVVVDHAATPPWQSEPVPVAAAIRRVTPRLHDIAVMPPFPWTDRYQAALRTRRSRSTAEGFLVVVLPVDAVGTRRVYTVRAGPPFP